jgi:hypothetical protein
MPGRPSLGQTLVVAGLVHVGLLFLSGRVPLRERTAESIAIEVADVWVEPKPLVTPPVPEPLEPAPSPMTPATPVSTSPGAHRSAAPIEPSTAVVVAPEATPETPSTWTVHVTQGTTPGSSEGLIPLAIDGPNHFMGRRELPEEAARAAREQANAAAGAAMRGALHDHDVSLGLGGGGPVVAALEAAVRQSTAPDASHAVLIAVADATGTVLRIDVESATDSAAYRSVADDLLIRLRGQTIRVPEGSHGLAMRIDVDSRVAMPSGGGIGLDPRSAGMHFDMSDLGAQAHRVIHARVLGEQLL